MPCQTRGRFVVCLCAVILTIALIVEEETLGRVFRRGRETRAEQGDERLAPNKDIAWVCIPRAAEIEVSRDQPERGQS